MERTNIPSKRKNSTGGDLKPHKVGLAFGWLGTYVRTSWMGTTSSWDISRRPLLHSWKLRSEDPIVNGRVGRYGHETFLRDSGENVCTEFHLLISLICEHHDRFWSSKSDAFLGWQVRGLEAFSQEGMYFTHRAGGWFGHISRCLWTTLWVLGQ